MTIPSEQTNIKLRLEKRVVITHRIVFREFSLLGFLLNDVVVKIGV